MPFKHLNSWYVEKFSSSLIFVYTWSYEHVLIRVMEHQQNSRKLVFVLFCTENTRLSEGLLKFSLKEGRLVLRLKTSSGSKFAKMDFVPRLWYVGRQTSYDLQPSAFITVVS